MEFSTMISNRIKERAKQKNVTVKQVLLNCGLSDNFMSGLKKSCPKSDNLAKIADELDCSVDYLLGRNDNDPVTEEVLSLLQNLSTEQKKAYLEFLKQFSNK